MKFLEKLSKKERIGLAIAVIFVFSAFLDRAVIAPIHRQIQRLYKEVEIKEREFGQGVRNIKQKNIIISQYQKYTEYLVKGGSDEEEIAKVLSELEGLARETYVGLIDVRPQLPTRTEFYRIFYIEVEIESEMDSLVNFLYQLNNSPQLLRTKKVRFSLKDKDSPFIKATFLITKVVI